MFCRLAFYLKALIGLTGVVAVSRLGKEKLSSEIGLIPPPSVIQKMIMLKDYVFASLGKSQKLLRGNIVSISSTRF